MNYTPGSIRFGWLFLLLGLMACNRDITLELQAPSISFPLDQQTYSVLQGQEVLILPIVKDNQGATYKWTENDRILSTEAFLKYAFEQVGTHYIMFYVVTSGGSASAMVQVTVTAPDNPGGEDPDDPDDDNPDDPNGDDPDDPDGDNPDDPDGEDPDDPDGEDPDDPNPVPAPVITVDTLFTVYAAETLVIAPMVAYAVNASYAWVCAADTLGRDSLFRHAFDVAGRYALTLFVEAAGGRDSAFIAVEVKEVIPPQADPEPCALDVVRPLFYEGALRERYCFAGRSVKVQALVGLLGEVLSEGSNRNGEAIFEWTCDGHVVGNGASLVFTPPGQGTYALVVTATLEGEVLRRGCDTVVVRCPGSEGASRRSLPASGVLHSTRVFTYCPAPGQFINENKSGFSGQQTMQEACAFAQGRLDQEAYLSLGSFGGYVTVGFDHSVTSLAVLSNVIDNASEPGAVWVMQDVNGNGLPDEQWYLLKGSVQEIVYASVTYFKPAQAGARVDWVDAQGGTGFIPYMGAYHTQDTYYPLWVDGPSYTLTGLLLPANVSQNTTTGYYVMNSYEWGYADNLGSDTQGQLTRFSLSNAVDAEGESVTLSYVDFVKIQTAVMATAGPLGEISTEIRGVYDTQE